MTVHLTPMEVLAGLGGLLVLFLVWRVSRRAARRAAEAARTSVRLMSLGGRVTVTGGLIAGVQWVIVTHSASVVHKGLLPATIQ